VGRLTGRGFGANARSSMTPPSAFAPPPTLEMGWKVQVAGSEDHGFGEIAGPPDLSNSVEVHFYISPVHRREIRVPADRLQRSRPLSRQTRCYYRHGQVPLNGRVLERDPDADSGPTRAYRVQFPDGDLRTLRETDFR